MALGRLGQLAERTRRRRDRGRGGGGGITIDSLLAQLQGQQDAANQANEARFQQGLSGFDARSEAARSRLGFGGGGGGSSSGADSLRAAGRARLGGRPLANRPPGASQGVGSGLTVEQQQSRFDAGQAAAEGLTGMDAINARIEASRQFATDNTSVPTSGAGGPTRGPGGVALDEVGRRAERQIAESGQNLASRGLSGTTIGQGNVNAIRAGEATARADINERQARIRLEDRARSREQSLRENQFGLQQTSFLDQIQQQRLGFIERRTDAGPDIGAFSGLLQQLAFNQGQRGQGQGGQGGLGGGTSGGVSGAEAGRQQGLFQTARDREIFRAARVRNRFAFTRRGFGG